jgi:hypothetical protein
VDQKEIVDAEAVIVGGWSSLALDAQGNPRISYSDSDRRRLKYAGESGGVWTLETVEVTNGVWPPPDRARHAQGNPASS